ncbi:hypothetical protein [Sphingobium sp.]|uniref:hypothetical protein n=1 Tax=Sphingobium sp. TaxID=1912891 RepID=UPI003B3B4219
MARTSPTVNDGKASGQAGEAEETRLNILDVATLEFADKGLSGARIDDIIESWCRA